MNLDTKKVILLRGHSYDTVFSQPDQTEGDEIFINDDVTHLNNRWRKVKLPFKIEGSKIEQHPFKKDHMLTVAVGVNDKHALWITSDGGYWERGWKFWYQDGGFLTLVLEAKFPATFLLP